MACCMALRRLGVVVVVLGLLALAQASVSGDPYKPLFDAGRHRRSLLAATQQISQCDWIAGEGCALHPAYASYALNRTSGDSDVVAQYVSSALACATATDKGLCESASYCYWDPAFSNGQQGCFLHEGSLLALQLRCVQPQYQASLGKLQACMAARHSCQCSSGSSSSSSSSCTQRQQQLQASYSSSRDKVCSSLLGCWLSSLNGSSPDVTALVQAQLVLVQPKIEALSSSSAGGAANSSSSSGGRRRLQQMPPMLSDPVLDDKSGSSDGYLPESGAYGSSGGAAPTPAVGMNGVVTDDASAGGSSAKPVENAKNVPGPTKPSAGGSGGNSSEELLLESGVALNSSDWALEQGSVDIDKLIGSSPAGSSSSPSASPAAGGSSTSSDGSVTMAGGNAPPRFWQCAANAAAKADATRKWADVDYNSKSLTLATWAKVLQPTALIDWGVQVLECFKTEVPSVTTLDTSSGAGANATKPNKESLEYATVALIRAFSGQADAFRSYLAASSAPASGLAALGRLTSDVFPRQLQDLTATYASSPAYARDVMLQAATIITDMQWFAGDVAALSASAGSASAGTSAAKRQQQQLFEAYVNYAEEAMRRCLYWIFHLQFEGPPAHLPGAVPSSPASAGVLAAFDGLAAAALPAAVVAADAPGWAQLHTMVAMAAGSASAAAAASGVALDGSEVLANSVVGLAKAHAHDLWGSRLELARAGAPDAARMLALADPTLQAARWEPLRQRQLAMLAALQQRAALGRSVDDSANLQLTAALQDLVAASGAYLLTANSSGSAGFGTQQQQQRQLADALSLSGRVALLVRQCYGSPVGLAALPAAAAAAAGVPATAAAACAQLALESEKMAAPHGGGGIIGSTLRADLDRQWRCNAAPAAGCSAKPGCVLALAPLLVPGAAPAAAEGPQLVCQASDASLALASLDSSSKSALAAGGSCDSFLKLPACEAVGSGATCNSFSTCRWEPSGQRNLLHTAANASRSPAAGSKGVCAHDWVAVLSSTGSGAAYNSLTSMVQMCASISEPSSCDSQTMLITLDIPAPATTSQARFWVPALVVAAVIGMLLFGTAMWWRRRSSAARRAADEAQAAAGGGRGGARGGKGGKDGKGGKGGLKKKAKRAEPGEYKPDLMRDSFTDYMRAAPQQFENGVAIAKAAMATGSLDTAVAVADVAGGRPLSPASQQAAGARRAPSPVLPSGAGYAVRVSADAASDSQGSSDLIDLACAGYDGGAASGSREQQHSDQGDAAAAARGASAGSVWGAAAQAASSSGGLPLYQQYQQQQSGRGGGGLLQGGLSVPNPLLEANASLALTSSIGLVSSLPHHSSLPVGLLPESLLLQQQQQQYGGAAYSAAAARAGFGASTSLARISGSSHGSSAFGGRAGSTIEAVHSGALLLPPAASGRGGIGGSGAGAVSEDGSMTPTSSCCHDSVCTFARGPGSAAGSSIAGSSRGGSGSAAGRMPPPLPVGGRTSPEDGAAAAAAAPAGGASALSQASSLPLSRSSWNSAVSSTELLMQSQTSSAI